MHSAETTTVASLMLAESSLFEKLRDLKLELEINQNRIIVHSLSIKPQLIQRIKELQQKDSRFKEILNNLESKLYFWLRADGGLVYQGRLCVPNNRELT